MIGDVVKAVRDALEPEPTTVNKSPGRRRPWQWKENTLYVYPIGTPTYTQVETDPLCLRLNYSLQAVYVLDSEGEEAQQERYERIDDAIEAKLNQYIAILASRSGIPHDVALTDFTVDTDFFSDLDQSGAALVINGYQLP